MFVGGTLNPNAPTFNYPQKKYSHPFRNPAMDAHHAMHAHMMNAMSPHAHDRSSRSRCRSCRRRVPHAACSQP